MSDLAEMVVRCRQALMTELVLLPSYRYDISGGTSVGPALWLGLPNWWLYRTTELRLFEEQAGPDWYSTRG
ncbi:hypothetical protein, partial [Cysteiniphilum litorale]|uniref:hypothetical protein n=1 Tax=Cysteiniphilum litorale TaxID=2056700 RepID=UPI003F8816D9